ncbi:hypothetical protein OPV22_029677 [Ensete ventricosum]|uniref:Uncharacterized protein n=1 Tax=Ensete ventricosum TaxID=4639 RepID=A0AAV8Q6H7_ENSVE|nr:hypothetical protein OPV22_029677 [Ensete ventricosum]
MADLSSQRSTTFSCRRRVKKLKSKQSPVPARDLGFDMNFVAGHFAPTYPGKIISVDEKRWRQGERRIDHRSHYWQILDGYVSKRPDRSLRHIEINEEECAQGNNEPVKWTESYK